MTALFRPPAQSLRTSTGLLIIRVLAGVAFIYHGYDKILDPFGWMGDDAPFPALLLALAALSEFGGGIAWILGVLTPLASLGLACTMAVATWFLAVVREAPFVASGGSSYELAAVYLAVALLLLLSGPGKLSLDAVLFRRRAANERTG